MCPARKISDAGTGAGAGSLLHLLGIWRTNSGQTCTLLACSVVQSTAEAELQPRRRLNLRWPEHRPSPAVGMPQSISQGNIDVNVLGSGTYYL